MKAVIITCATLLSLSVTAQNVGINTTGAVPLASAMLDIDATNRGLLIPRVALTATNAAGPITAPATSLLVYNSATAGVAPNNVTPGYYYWDGAQWVRFDTGNNIGDWKILGNANTTAGTNFVGTTNAQALDFRTNNTIRFRIANGDQVYAMANGTAALPFYSWNGDPNTGTYLIGADNLGLSTGGIERVGVSNAEAVVNDASNDFDFRVETNNQTHALFVDGGQDVVGVRGVPTAPFELGAGIPVNTMYYPFEVGSDGNLGQQIAIGYYRASDPTLNPEQNGGWGYVGYNAIGAGNDQYWWRGYSGGWINVSERELKRDIVSINEVEDIENYLIKSILKIKPSLYNYKNEEKTMVAGLENHYRPAYRIGLIADETPDYILDESFSGVDIYGLATLSLVGTQYSIKEIEKIKANQIIHDFGTQTLNNKTEIWVDFNENFENVIPVITLSSSNPDVVLSVVEKTSKGFKVIASKNTSSTNFDWIAMAKTKANINNADAVLSNDFKNKLELPANTKSEIINFYENFKPTLTPPTLNEPKK